MKHPLTILCLLACNALAQNAAVTKSTVTGRINGDVVVSPANLLNAGGVIQANSQLQKTFGTDQPLDWGNFYGHFSIYTDSPSHGLISQSSGAAGIAIIGKSTNGAAAGKFLQQNSDQTSRSALYVARDVGSFGSTGNGFPTLPALSVEGGSDGYNYGDHDSLIAVFKGAAQPRFQVFNDGFVTAPGVLAAYVSHANPQAVMTYQWGLQEFKNTVVQGAAASSQTLTSTVLKNIPQSGGTVILNTPGVWEVWATVEVTSTVPANVGKVEFGISTNTTTFDSTWDTNSHVATWNSSPLRAQTIRRLFEVSSSQAVYLNVRATFSSGTATANGIIKAVKIQGVPPQ
jgi:hypothetical protein